MKRLALTLMAMLALDSHALDIPIKSSFDSRIQYVDYNEADVVAIHTVVAVGTKIVFDVDEKILHVASGFSQGWDFPDRDNLLWVKPKTVLGQGHDSGQTPKPGLWNTNLDVTTNKRHYTFDLILLPANKKNKEEAAYRVTFRYPAEEASKNTKLANQKSTETKLSQKSAPVNWSYAMQVGDNSSNIMPVMAYDDGRFTYLKFPHNRAFPNVYLVEEDKSESVIPSHLEASTPDGVKDVLVIHRVAPEFVLRYGNQVVAIYNEAFDPNGVAPMHGTTVPGVKRVFKDEAKR